MKLENYETINSVLTIALDDMASMGLVEFRTNATGGPCWVVIEQKTQVEPDKQDKAHKKAA